MKPRSLILIVLIVLLPTGLLAWFGVRMARDEKTVTEQRFRSVMEQRLQDVNRVIARQFSETERQLQVITAIDDFSVSQLRECVRSTPEVTQLFVLSSNGELLYPNPSTPLNGTEQSFLRQTSKMFSDRDLQNAVTLAEVKAGAEDSVPPAKRVQLDESRGISSRTVQSPAIVVSGEPQRDGPAEMVASIGAPAITTENDAQSAELQSQALSTIGFQSTSGWFVWYWDRGLNLVFWQRRPSGHLVGASLDRSRWIADIIEVLPEFDSASSRTTQLATSFRVVNATSETVYDWGPEISDSAVPFSEIPVTAPLASWRLQCFVDANQLNAGTGRNAVMTLVSGLSAFTLTLVVLAWLLYCDYSRDIRVASQQVSFVNQVSHELKTPLTNIRMYAELLERDLDQAEPEVTAKPRERLSVITSEAQRLSRLIGNVLTFARQSRKTLKPHPCATNVAMLVQQIVERFTPSLTEHGIVPGVEIISSLDSRADGLLKVDPDFIEQILGNLINNVERYAAEGKSLHVRCETTSDRVTIDVIDRGCGIATVHRSEVFRPFTRLNNDLRASTGTGIGLSIARDLARLHNGDVRLLDAAKGCWFRVELGTFVA